MTGTCDNDRDLRQLTTPTRDDRDLRQLTTPTRDDRDLRQFQTTYTQNPKELRQLTTPIGHQQTTPLRDDREPRQLTPPIRHQPTTPSRDDCQPITQSKPVFHLPQARSHTTEFLTPSRDVTKAQSTDPPRPKYVRIPAGPRSCPPCSPTTRISQDASPGKKAIYFEVDHKADDSTILRKIGKLIEQVERPKGKYRDDAELVPILALQNPPKRRIKRQLSSDSDSQSSASSSLNSSCTPDKLLGLKHATSNFPNDLVPSSGTTLTFSQKRLKSSPESNQPPPSGQQAAFDNILHTNKPTQARTDNENLQHSPRVSSPLQLNRPRTNSNFRHRVGNSPSEIWPPLSSYDTHVFESPTAINSTSLIPVSPKTHRDERTVVKRNFDQNPPPSHSLSQVKTSGYVMHDQEPLTQSTSNVIKTTTHSNHREKSVILGNRYRDKEPEIFVFPDVNPSGGSKDDEVDGFDSPMDMDEDMDNGFNHSRSHFHGNSYVDNSNGFSHIRYQTSQTFNSSGGSNYAQSWSTGSSRFNNGETSYGTRGYHQNAYRYHDNRMDDLDSGGVARHRRAEVSRTPRDNASTLPPGLGEVFDASEPDDSPYDDGTGCNVYSGWNSGHNSGVVATRASTQVSCVITESELRRATMTSRDDDSSYLATDGYGDDYLPLPGVYDGWDEMDGPDVHNRHAQITPEMRLARLQVGAGYHSTVQPNSKKGNIPRDKTTDGDLCPQQNRTEQFSQEDASHLKARLHNPVHRVLSTDRKRFNNKPEVNDTQRYTQEDGYTDLRDFENDWVSAAAEGGVTRRSHNHTRDGQLFYAKGRSPVSYTSHPDDSGDEVDGFGDKSNPEPDPGTSSSSSNTVSCFGTSSSSSKMFQL
ncbi:uncharacterized protein LOC131929354 [Physella acuta]|uniref:uncharacterized protein LOC131929354 n=1 Tax=Physella acuta TaxID=109671 RepID=UPI0027DC677D|nr:uncharacterized protein LOC131929354 [Physella acuta]